MILPLTLPIGWTKAELLALLAPLRDDAVLTGAAADERGVTLGWSSAGHAHSHASSHDGEHDASEPAELTGPAALPALPQVARELRHLPAAPGRPTIQKTGEALGFELRRSDWLAIVSVFAGCWPPDPAWWAHLPEPAPAAEPDEPAGTLRHLRELPAAPAADGR